MPVQPASPYLNGSTALIACQADPRFSYCLHVPASLDWSGARPAALMVLVHGSRRMAQQERDCFIDFSERHGVVVLAPVFPIGSGGPDDTESYKLLRANGICYDQVLLSMVDEVALRYPVRTERFFLHGFSGGGQFAHRFYYFHPRRLAALSIGAPGNVTLIDPQRPWWVGTGGGPALDLDAMRAVPVLMLVGADDTSSDEVRCGPGSQHWMEGINDCGPTRIARLRCLQNNFLQHGISVSYAEIAGVGHQGFSLVAPVKQHFASVLESSHPFNQSRGSQ